MSKLLSDYYDPERDGVVLAVDGTAIVTRATFGADVSGGLSQAVRERMKVDLWNIMETTNMTMQRVFDKWDLIKDYIVTRNPILGEYRLGDMTLSEIQARKDTRAALAALVSDVEIGH